MKEGVRPLMRRLADALASRWPVALRDAISVGIPLLTGALSHHARYGALASIGSFAGFYGAQAPYRRRIRLVAGVGLTLTVLMPLGSLCARTAWLSVLLVGLVAAGAGFVCLALRVPPPREYLIVLAVLAATGIPAGPAGALLEAGLVAAGALLSGVITMAPALPRGHRRPQLRALAQAWAAVGDVLSTAGTAGAGAARDRAVAAVAQAREALGQAGVAGQAASLRSLAALQVTLASALSVSHEAREPLDPRWRLSVSELESGAPPTSAEPPASAGAGGNGDDLPGLRSAVNAARRIQQGSDAEQDLSRLPRPSVAVRLRAALDPDAVIVTSAVRIGVAVAAAAALGRVLGLGHSYWVGLTAAAALQANNVTFLVRRVGNRLIGTLAGVVLGWAVFSSHPGVLAVAVMAVVAQFISETLIAAAYGLAVVFVTVLALSIYDLGAPHAQIGAALGARALDTVLGAAVVVLLRLVLWRRAAASRVPSAQAGTVRATAEVFRIRWLSEPPADPGPAQRRLAGRLLRLRSLTADASADRIPGTTKTPPGQTELAVEELAMLALGVPFERPRPPRREAEAVVGRLEQLAGTLAGTLGEGALPAAGSADNQALELAGYPRTVAATGLLAAALGAAGSAGDAGAAGSAGAGAAPRVD